jgi:hypothetical protein
MERRMSYNLFRLIAAVFVWVIGALVAGAAEIGQDPSSGRIPRAVLEGRIESGDFDKFTDFVLKRDNAVEIYLASPGGDLGEAIKIGLAIRQLNLSTIVPGKVLTNQSFNLAATRHNLKGGKANYLCASACFFIFVAGIHRQADDVGPAILGIHKPILLDNELKTLGNDQSTAAEKRTRMTVENYLRAMDVPAKYVAEMYSVPKGGTKWVRNDEFESDFAGFIPELRNSVNSKCGPESKDLKHPTRIDCEIRVQDDLALRAYGRILKKKDNEVHE